MGVVLFGRNDLEKTGAELAVVVLEEADNRCEHGCYAMMSEAVRPAVVQSYPKLSAPKLSEVVRN